MPRSTTLNWYTEIKCGPGIGFSFYARRSAWSEQLPEFYALLDLAEDGFAFRQRLLQEGILVRDCKSFGLPAYVRIATRRPEENARLVAAISAKKGLGEL